MLIQLLQSNCVPWIIEEANLAKRESIGALMAYTSYEEPAKDELVMTEVLVVDLLMEKVLLCQIHQFLLLPIVIVVGKISVINCK